MKKTSYATFNLKFMRFPLLLCSFALFAALCTGIGFSVPPIKLENSLVEVLLSSSTTFTKTHPSELFFLSKLVPVSSVTEINPVKQIQPDDIILQSSLPEKTDKITKVSISNSTEHEIDISKYLVSPPEFLDETISVLIVHTHTTESYTPSPKYSYTPTDTDRTTDKNFNMVRVGEAVAKILESKGIKVHHDTTINDYPSYNGSYNRSSKNVQNAIANDPSIKIVLDIHRDAIERNGEKVKYTFTHDNKTGACVMFVAGSSLSGLPHENWETNMQFAATLQSHIQSYYPALMRPINFRNQRFNQHLAPGAIIVEVGTNGNTLDEALFGAECFANALADYIKGAY